MSTITIYASCHCKTFNTSFDVSSSAFPLKSSLCHCNSCRYTSGSLFGTFMVLPLPYSQTPSTKGLRGYASSEKLTRWFCTSCGARCWNDDRTADSREDWEWEICIGLVDRVEVDGQERKEVLEGLLDRVQMWVADTGDGGGCIWVNGGLLQGMDRRAMGRQSKVVSDESLVGMSDALQKEARTAESVLPLECHCQSVRLAIKLDDPAVKLDASLDACESCRKVTGSEVRAWFAVPASNVQFASGRSLDLQAEEFGSYSSSSGVFRYFCKTCGAHVFYQKQGSDILSVTAGLLRAEGARAEQWLNWYKAGIDHVEFPEDSVDRKFIDGLIQGRTNASHATE